MKIQADIVKVIKDSVDIIDLISAYIDLEKRSDKYYGLCPFHNDSKPSFAVDPYKGFYYCFGCQRGGDIIKFIETIENMEFLEAVQFICEKYNIKYKKEWKKPEKDINYLYKINNKALNIFHTNLVKTKEGQKSLEYLRGRGIEQKTIEDFTIGYSFESWNALYNELSKDYKDSELEKSGLFKKNDRGHLYDAYRGRVIFPIRDIHDRVIGFGGRVINDDSREAKYINSPKTPVYEKNRSLFGIDLSRKAISRSGYAVLVEGYLDAISLHQAGIESVVACLGTALTEHQVELIKRYCRKLYICFDADQAGIKSALSNFDLIQKYEINSFYIDISPAKDPDEFIKAWGAEEFFKKLKEAPSLEDIVIKRHISSVTKDKKSLDKDLFADTMSRLLSIKDYIKRYKYFEELASLLKTDSSAIIREYNRIRKKKITEGSQGKAVHAIAYNVVPQNDKKILKALFLMNMEEIQYFQESLYETISLDSALKPIISLICSSNGSSTTSSLLRDNLSRFDECLAGIIIRTEQEIETLTHEGKNELKESVIKKLYNAMLRSLQKKIASASGKEEADRLLKQKIEVKQRLLNKEGG